MPVVPFAPRNPTGPSMPQVPQAFLLMAAADLHEAGRLVEPVPTPKPRPFTGQVYSTQEGNTEKINDDVPMNHPARIKRMDEALRAKLIPQSTYDDYMAMAKDEKAR